MGKKEQRTKDLMNDRLIQVRFGWDLKNVSL